MSEGLGVCAITHREGRSKMVCSGDQGGRFLWPNGGTWMGGYHLVGACERGVVDGVVSGG